MKLIDADALVKVLEPIHDDQEFANKDIWRAIEHAPAIETARKKGEWIGDSDGYADGEPVYDIWSCSVCGKYFDEWEDKPDWKFCPNCGSYNGGE